MSFATTSEADSSAAASEADSSVTASEADSSVTASEADSSAAASEADSSATTTEADSSFSHRHIGPTEMDIQKMLKTLNCKNLNELVEKAASSEILNCDSLDLPAPLTEANCLKTIKEYAAQNQIFKNYIGMGYYETELPTVIQRNILENPVWLTSYTPYQSEISQGRLQALLNFQTMITELTEMDVANSSLLDEGTAAAEAMSMALGNTERETSENYVFIDENIFPQTKAVLRTRACSIGLKIITGQATHFNFNEKDFCTRMQYPDSTGAV